jgi:hypothetical protein
MIQQAIKTIRTLLPSSGSVTPEEIENAVNIAISIPNYADIDRDALMRETQSIYNIRMDDFRIIEVSERRMPWIGEKKASLAWDFWNRYRDYLTIEKNFSDTVVNQLDRLTDRTLDGLFDPTINAGISKYGLVVGQVQSGKTSNYTGLICKAARLNFALMKAFWVLILNSVERLKKTIAGSVLENLNRTVLLTLSRRVCRILLPGQQMPTVLTSIPMSQ